MFSILFRPKPTPERQAWHVGAVELLSQSCKPHIVARYKRYVFWHGLGKDTVAYFRALCDQLTVDDLLPLPPAP